MCIVSVYTITPDSRSPTWSSFVEMPACLPFYFPFRAQREATIAQLGVFVPICHCLSAIRILRVTQYPQHHPYSIPTTTSTPQLPLWHPELQLCHSQTHEMLLRLLLIFLYPPLVLYYNRAFKFVCVQIHFSWAHTRDDGRFLKKTPFVLVRKCCLYVVESDEDQQRSSVSDGI